MSLLKNTHIKIFKLVVVLFLVALAPINLSFAGPIYSWKDKNGVKHYTTKAPSKTAKPAKLPTINRGEMKLVKKKLVSCKSHGGIDCQAGADKDGSVVCYDGFKGASARYRFSCSTPKLEISEVSEVSERGEFKVYIRNSKAVKASKPAVFFKPDTGREFKLSGPKEIEPFGIAEFDYEPVEDAKPVTKVTLAQINITCANC